MRQNSICKLYHFLQFFFVLCLFFFVFLLDQYIILFVMRTDIDIQRLSHKAQLVHTSDGPLASRRRIIQSLHESRQNKLKQAQEELNMKDIQPEVVDNDIYVEGHSLEKSRTQIGRRRVKVDDSSPLAKVSMQKNPGVGDLQKMLFDKKFKNYLQHQEEFEEKAKRRRNAIREKRRKLRDGGAEDAEQDDYYNEDEILSNTGSDYQYKDVEDMQAAYETLTTGKRKKKGFQLFFAEKFQLSFRFKEFQMILSEAQNPDKGLVSKEQLLNYLFDEPMVMMLYSINPYLIADQISEEETQVPSMLSFEEFSCFLLVNREPTYFQYTAENLQEARNIGRGLKCAPIVGKWIDETGIYDELMDMFNSVDMFGNGSVERSILSKKIYLECEKKRYLDIEVVEIVNINKLVPMSRLIYELEHQITTNEKISRDEFVDFLQNYHRLPTPQKDKLVTKLIMAGKYDTSYIYIVNQEVLDFVKEVFQEMEKFAEYFVRKQKFVEKVTKSKKYPRMREKLVRSEGNRYVMKEDVQETLARILNEADEYVDIEDILDFFTNRGRPRIVEYKVYLANLERQLAVLQEEERQRQLKLAEGQEITSSSDEEFQTQIRKKRIERKKKKLEDIHKSMNFNRQKRYNVTIPTGFTFDQRDKNKKISIRERRVKEMIDEKKQKQDESMKPIIAKQVPKHVKQNLFEKMMKDQERERLERLERFRLEILGSIVPMAERLTAPKKIHTAPHRNPFEFVARPMPWYCEVNLLDRINKKKQQRKQRILEEIINRHHDNDLPEGVLRMLERHEEIDKKRAAKKNNTISTRSVGDCTFIPKITQGIPDFTNIHANLGIDLDIAREQKKPVFPQPFSFQNRQERSRTTHDNCVPKLHPGQPLSHSREYKQPVGAKDIKTTLKHTGLISKRMQEREERERKMQIEQRNEITRRMRQQKFAPQVRRALKRNQSQGGNMSKSRNKIMERLREFQKQEKVKKREYENQMFHIYTKVWNRPLLIEEGGIGSQAASQQKQNIPREQQKESRKVVVATGMGKKKNKNTSDPRKQQQLNQEYEEKRRRVVEQPPGQYLLEGDEGEGQGEDEHGDQREYEHEGREYEYEEEGEDGQYEEEYEYIGGGALHTS